MFDPEKVERHIQPNWPRGGYVLASDYDQLLTLYLGLRAEMAQGMNDSRAASTVNNILKQR